MKTLPLEERYAKALIELVGCLDSTLSTPIDVSAFQATYKVNPGFFDALRDLDCIVKDVLADNDRFTRTAKLLTVLPIEVLQQEKRAKNKKPGILFYTPKDELTATQTQTFGEEMADMDADGSLQALTGSTKSANPLYGEPTGKTQKDEVKTQKIAEKAQKVAQKAQSAAPDLATALSNAGVRNHPVLEHLDKADTMLGRALGNAEVSGSTLLEEKPNAKVSTVSPHDLPDAFEFAMVKGKPMQSINGPCVKMCGNLACAVNGCNMGKPETVVPAASVTTPTQWLSQSVKSEKQPTVTVTTSAIPTFERPEDAIYHCVNVILAQTDGDAEECGWLLGRVIQTVAVDVERIAIDLNAKADELKAQADKYTQLAKRYMND
ncbi:hypothetical protein A6C57_23335 [Fibrella sp. ES10-3-2-2]|nr:hypothetical protein A6C57_23335 [Fibrella sp. ES10-3-2-2]